MTEIEQEADSFLTNVYRTITPPLLLNEDTGKTMEDVIYDNVNFYLENHIENAVFKNPLHGRKTYLIPMVEFFYTFRKYLDGSELQVSSTPIKIKLIIEVSLITYLDKLYDSTVWNENSYNVENDKEFIYEILDGLTSVGIFDKKLESLQYYLVKDIHLLLTYVMELCPNVNGLSFIVGWDNDNLIIS